MSRLSKLFALSLVFVVGIVAVSSAALAAQYDVTITNLSNQIFSPPIVVSHAANVSVFEVGQEPSDELAAVAEDAAADGLIALLGTVDGVRDIAMGGDVLLPGHSMTVSVDAGGPQNVFTVLGMLVTTNDSFYSARKQVRRGATFYGLAYDAGSEANTLSCDHIPGPPCFNPGVRVTEGAEGRIKISEGINRGELVEFDWRNPVAKVRVRRAGK